MLYRCNSSCLEHISEFCSVDYTDKTGNEVRLINNIDGQNGVTQA